MRTGFDGQLSCAGAAPAAGIAIAASTGQSNTAAPQRLANVNIIVLLVLFGTPPTRHATGLLAQSSVQASNEVTKVSSVESWHARMVDHCVILE